MGKNDIMRKSEEGREGRKNEGRKNEMEGRVRKKEGEEE